MNVTRVIKSAVAAVLATTLSVAVAAGPAQASVALRHRAEGSTVTAVGGTWSPYCSGCLGGRWLLFFNGQNVVLKGQGYFQVRWEVAYFNSVGEIHMPTWTGRSGTLLHVASGGGHRMDDAYPGGVAGQTWMGKPSTGYDWLPSGTPMIWQNEFYYLDGTVTLTNQEVADYNLGVIERTYSQVYNDINTAPVAGTSLIRYGVSYDK